MTGIHHLAPETHLSSLRRSDHDRGRPARRGDWLLALLRRRTARDAGGAPHTRHDLTGSTVPTAAR